MNDFLPRRGQKNMHLRPSKSAAEHTAQNLRPHTPEPSEVYGSHVNPEPPKTKRSLKDWLHGLTKKQKIIFAIVAAVLVIGGGIGTFFLLKSDKPVAQQQQKEEVKEEAPKPTTVASSLSGLPVDPAVNDRPVTGVMIENSLDARPQAGILGASVVFEAIAEGGITRFLTLFQDAEPDYVGPVRSARPYYVQWALGFDAAYAHAGGSPDALNLINSTGMKDLNHHSSYFWRVNNRTAPHNLYTSIAKLREYENQKGYGKPNFTPLVRKSDAPSPTPTARTIDFNISSANYNTHYDYDAATNSYKRTIAGKAHIDEKTGVQLSPRVLVALIMAQGKNGQYTTYGTIGSGQVVIFQDGTVTEGTWKKDSNTSNFSFIDASGKPISLNAGQTWFTALGGRERITFAP